MNSATTQYPLIFSYRDLIAGNGFVAAVAIEGRVLLDTSDGEFWMYGVQPGGIAGGGADRDTAFSEFKNRYMSVLYDLAADSKAFKDFKIEVERFFAEVNEPNVQAWTEALSAVRQAATSLEGLARVEKADSRQYAIRVDLLDMKKTKPKDTGFGEIKEAA